MTLHITPVVCGGKPRFAEHITRRVKIAIAQSEEELKKRLQTAR